MKTVRLSQLCNFFDSQVRATKIADAHRYTLYGGSRGPGKSYWLRWYCVRYLLRCHDKGLNNVRVGLFCEDYPSLKDRHINKIAEFPRWLGQLSDSKEAGLAFRLHEIYGAGIVALRNLDDSSKYKSSEFALIAVDELTQNTQDVFDRLRGSMRWTGIREAKFISASNPDGKGQKWVRSYFIEKSLPDELMPYQDRFAFIPALPGDNPYLPASYWDELNSLPDNLRRAWRDGDWYVTMEGLVYSEFGADNILNFDWEPDPNIPVELAVDDGFIDPRVILFIQKTPTNIYVFDEIYHSRHLAETCVNEVVERCSGYNLECELAVGSPEAKELQEQFRKANIRYRFMPHKVIEGINHTRRMIRDASGFHPMKVHPRCKNFIDELSHGYRYPPLGSRSKDEIPLDENNHACDAFRYWAYMRAK